MSPLAISCTMIFPFTLIILNKSPDWEYPFGIYSGIMISIFEPHPIHWRKKPGAPILVLIIIRLNMATFILLP